MRRSSSRLTFIGSGVLTPAAWQIKWREAVNFVAYRAVSLAEDLLLAHGFCGSVIALSCRVGVNIRHHSIKYSNVKVI